MNVKDQGLLNIIFGGAILILIFLVMNLYFINGVLLNRLRFMEMSIQKVVK